MRKGDNLKKKSSEMKNNFFTSYGNLKTVTDKFEILNKFIIKSKIFPGIKK